MDQTEMGKPDRLSRRGEMLNLTFTSQPNGCATEPKDQK